MRKQNFAIKGMNCAACKARIESCVQGLSGVDDVSVQLLQNSMTVIYNERKCSNETICHAISTIGYEASVVKSTKELNLQAQKVLQGFKIKLIASLIITALLLIVSMGPMVGLNLIPQALFNAYIQLALCVVVMVLNYHYFKNGFKALAKLAPNMDSLVALGASASFVSSFYNLFFIPFHLNSSQLHHNFYLYFEGVATILTLVSLGKFFESRAKAKAMDALAYLYDLVPETVNRRIIDTSALSPNLEESFDINEIKTSAEVLYTGLSPNDPTQRERKQHVYKEESIEIDKVQIGDEIVIRAGERIGVDGVIIEGHGVFDESAVTGESKLVNKSIGDKVVSSSIMRYGYIVFKVQSVGQDTVLAKIIALVDDANKQKANISRLADRIAFYFVPVVILLAILTLVIWVLNGAPILHAINFAVSVLVVSCPCALGLATPTAIMVGTGRAAKLGVLFQSPEVIEKLHLIDIMVLDKTGTITQGSMHVVGIRTQEIDALNITPVLEIAQALEEKSEHPIAQAIVRYCMDVIDKENLIKLNSEDQAELFNTKAQTQSLSRLSNKVEHYVTHEGRGIEAIIDNELYFLGSTAFLNEKCPEHYEEALGSVAEAPVGASVVHLFNQDELLCSFYIGDEIKASAPFMIELLRHLNIRPIMVSGDTLDVVKDIASQVGISTYKASCMPQDKARFIEQLQYNEHIVGMVGDGINDAPSITKADVGISFAKGTDIAQSCASLILMKSSLLSLIAAISLSKLTIRNIKENLFWAFIYNIICIPIAMGLFYDHFDLRLDPMLAAFLMSLSSLCVVGNALRLRNAKLKVRLNSGEEINLEEIEQDSEKLKELENNIRNTTKHNVESALGVDTDENLQIAPRVHRNTSIKNSLKSSQRAQKLVVMSEGEIVHAENIEQDNKLTSSINTLSSSEDINDNTQASVNASVSASYNLNTLDNANINTKIDMSEDDNNVVNVTQAQDENKVKTFNQVVSLIDAEQIDNHDKTFTFNNMSKVEDYRLESNNLGIKNIKEFKNEAHEVTLAHNVIEHKNIAIEILDIQVKEVQDKALSLLQALPFCEQAILSDDEKYIIMYVSGHISQSLIAAVLNEAHIKVQCIKDLDNNQIFNVVANLLNQEHQEHYINKLNQGLDHLCEEVNAYNDAIWWNKVVYIDGMHCSHCQNTVTKALSALENCLKVEVDLLEKCAYLQLKAEIKDELIIDAIKQVNFKVVTIFAPRKMEIANFTLDRWWNLKIEIMGMTCKHCRKVLMHALAQLQGITRINVDEIQKCAYLLIQDEVQDKDICKAINEVDFGVKSIIYYKDINLINLEHNSSQDGNKASAIDSDNSTDEWWNKLLRVEGLHCENCKQKLYEALKALDGCELVEVDLENQCVSMQTTDALKDEDLYTTIDNLGYKLVSIINA